MPKSLASSKQAMKNYLSELLTEEAPLPTPQQQEVERLLAKVAQQTPVETKPLINPIVEAPLSRKSVDDLAISSEVSVSTLPQGLKASPKPKSSKSYRKGEFQALFFDVAGLIVAVPLIELGGIHQLDKTTTLMGKPDWFMGVMLHRDEKINVVDTARWVMPDKCTPELLDKLDYRYVIMLGDSAWGVCAESLVDTVTLQQDDVKWLDGNSKRPWLAGLVKDRKCALLDVESMIALLAEGASIKNSK